MIDRYDIGERQTSACAMPTGWLYALGLEDSMRQTFSELVIHTPFATARYALPWTFSTFDYRTLCELLDAQNEVEFETAKVDGRTGSVVHTDRGDLSAPLIVDGMGWRRMLDSDTRFSPRMRPCRAGSRCTRAARRRTSRSGSTAATCRPATAGASRRATSCGSASAPSTPAST